MVYSGFGRVIVLVAVAAFLCIIPFHSYATEDTLQHFTLPNGLKVLIKEDHARKVTTIQYWVLVGSADEERSEGGISHLIEHMAFKGTERRGVGKIASEVEALGGEINAYTSWDQTVFHVTVPSIKTSEGLDILTDAVFRPVIDPGELDKEKQVVLEEILEGEERPERKASKLLFSTAYAASPYRFPVIGYKEIVEKFTRDDVLAFRKKWYVPENMFLLIIGDVDTAKLKPELERLTADLKPQGLFRPPRAQEPPQTQIRASVVRDANARETRLYMAFHIPAMEGNDVNALDLTGDILGGRESSRLVKVIKKEKALVNSISAYALTPKMPGLMLVSATLDASKLEATIRAIMEEIALLAKEPPSAEELQRAKIQIESHHLYSRETVQGMARSIGSFYAELGDPGYEEKYLRLNGLVTPEQICEAVRRYLEPPNVSISVLVPESSGGVSDADALKKIIDSFARPGAEPASQVAAKGQVVTSKLPNGIQVVLARDASNPVVSFRIALLGGKRFENKSDEGIMNFIAQMLTKGAGKMTEIEISRKVEDMGGRLAGFSGYDSFGFSASFFSRYLNEGLDLLAQLYKHPSFPQDRLERERTLILNRIKTEPDRPVQYAINVMNQTLFTQHPYGFDKEGTLETVAGFTVDDLKRTYERFAVPSNTVITAVGDMDIKKTMARITEVFGNIPQRALDAPQVPAEEPLTKVREKVVNIPRAKAHLVLGFRGTTFSDQDRYPLEVLNNVLAGQGGRLFLQLRDKESLAYSVTSFNRPGLNPGLFAFYIACEEAKANRALEGLFEQIAGIRKTKVGEGELKRAITNLIGNHLINLQSSWSRSENTALNTLYGLGYDFEVEYIKRIAAVKADDVLRVAKKYLDPKSCAIVKILPKEEKKEK